MNIERAKELFKMRIETEEYSGMTTNTLKEAMTTVLSELEKKETIIERYEIECKRFRKFCSKIRKTKKRNVDEFNQGQEHKCNQFLNLLAGEENWEFDGKYFDETDKEIDKVEREGK